MADNTTYAFVSREYWKLTSAGLAPGYPRDISDDWDGLPDRIDASFTIKGRTYFFKGSEYWLFKEFGKLERKYPRQISRTFKNVPEDLDAILLLKTKPKDQLFFFKGSTYCPYDFGTKSCGDQVSLNSIPADLDAALTDSAGDTYFFKGGEYYDFATKDEPPNQAGPAWFGCGGKYIIYFVFYFIR
jgi:hypothetical protein